jgi:hypothetical protein
LVRLFIIINAIDEICIYFWNALNQRQIFHFFGAGLEIFAHRLNGLAAYKTQQNLRKITLLPLST